MSRKLHDWLTGYLELTEDTESPLSFHTWVGLSVIAGALQRKVYMRWGHSTIYPNQYIVLVGPSGRVRKGDAIDIGRKLLKDITVPTTSERVTREALVRFMRNHVENYTDTTTGKVCFQCAVTCISEELSVLLGQREMGFLSDLTTWYDSRDEWTYETKGSGTDKVLGMCFNLLGATAPDWMPSMFAQEAIGGGFTSRVIFVVEEDKRKTVAEPIVIPDDSPIRRNLLHDLEEINSISGRISFTNKALALYKAWYTDEDERSREGNPAVPDPRFAGYCSRRATHIKKIATAFSASRGNDLRITEGDFKRALVLLESTEKKMPRAFRQVGQARYAAATTLLIDILKQQKTITRSTLLRRFYLDIDLLMLESIEKMLEQMGIVQVIVQPKKKDVLYKLIDEPQDAAEAAGDELGSQTDPVPVADDPFEPPSDEG